MRSMLGSGRLLGYTATVWSLFLQVFCSHEWTSPGGWPEGPRGIAAGMGKRAVCGQQRWRHGGAKIIPAREWLVLCVSVGD